LNLDRRSHSLVEVAVDAIENRQRRDLAADVVQVMAGMLVDVGDLIMTLKVDVIVDDALAAITTAAVSRTEELATAAAPCLATRAGVSFVVASPASMM
jgi:hypothetical protein